MKVGLQLVHGWQLYGLVGGGWLAHNSIVDESCYMLGLWLVHNR